jgi:hypothetical protein
VGRLALAFRGATEAGACNPGTLAYQSSRILNYIRLSCSSSFGLCTIAIEVKYLLLCLHILDLPCLHLSLPLCLLLLVPDHCLHQNFAQIYYFLPLEMLYWGGFCHWNTRRICSSWITASRSCDTTTPPRW